MLLSQLVEDELCGLFRAVEDDLLARALLDLVGSLRDLGRGALEADVAVIDVLQLVSAPDSDFLRECVDDH